MKAAPGPTNKKPHGHGPRTPSDMTARQIKLLRVLVTRTDFGGTYAIRELVSQGLFDKEQHTRQTLFQLRHSELVAAEVQRCGCLYYKATAKGRQFLREAELLKKGIKPTAMCEPIAAVEACAGGPGGASHSQG